MREKYEEQLKPHLLYPNKMGRPWNGGRCIECGEARQVTSIFCSRCGKERRMNWEIKGIEMCWEAFYQYKEIL